MAALEQIRSLVPRAQLARLLHGIARRALAPVAAKLDVVEENQYRLARELLRARAMQSHEAGRPIRVLFLCHLGSVWGKVSPLFRELRGDQRFHVDVVALPYRHSSFGDDEYHDAGIIEFLRNQEGVEAIAGYDASCDHWLDLQSLEPDYIFYPTPYDHQCPAKYGTAVTKYFAHLCYVPYYGILIYKGEVEAITHPTDFFRNLNFAFVTTDQERREVLAAAGPGGVLEAECTGAPMLDPLLGAGELSAETWNFPNDADRIRILWTPRWRIQEGTSHFLEYSDHLLDLVDGRDDIDFVFRPHPLLLENVVSAGYFNASALAALECRYERTANARIDRSDSYVDTFLTSDLLVTDISSMLVEYFVTGKPIIYTHRTNSFNDLGTELARGCYWARNETELDRNIQDIVEGRDRLASTRRELSAKLLGIEPPSATEKIKTMILAHHEYGHFRPDGVPAHEEWSAAHPGREREPS